MAEEGVDAAVDAVASGSELPAEEPLRTLLLGPPWFSSVTSSRGAKCLGSLLVLLVLESSNASLLAFVSS